MIVLPVGKTLGPGDLTLMVRDENNLPATPVSLNYTIFRLEEGGTQSLASEPMKVPLQQELDVVLLRPFSRVADFSSKN